jgi:exodeoxyribonuclease V gamma subunit
MLRVAFSNRFETLLDGLVDALARPPDNPFEAQQVIVPSRAVQRKIELALADRLGICANVEFSFLGSWLWRQIGRLVPVPEMSPFAPAVLAWRIYAILGDASFTSAHPRLARYLRDADPRMRYALAQRIAALLDQYITYRPDWLAAWVDGEAVRALAAAGEHVAEDQQWQAALWRRIAADIGTSRRHPSTAFFDAVAAAGPGLLQRAGIASSAHVVALPAIPPLYLDMLRQLGRFMELRLAVLNPCREYWFDVVDRKRLTYLAAQGTLDYQEEGNRLLASWGKQKQAQLRLLFEDNGEAQIDDDRFVEPGGRTMLACVQSAVLDLAQLPPDALSNPGRNDRSIEVHVCHSLTRELEVLHDFLLGLFASKEPPRPSDILVVTPNLDDAAPLIDAVFGTATGHRHIPYVITGRGRSTLNQAARALLDLLGLAASRFPASAVVEVLQQPIVARRFDISPPELERIRGWLRDAGIRWGLDARHRAELGLPAQSRYTFDDGLMRLLLGYALPSCAHVPPGSPAIEPLAGWLPAGDAEGTDALALGSLAAFVRALEELRATLVEPKAAPAWTQTLLDAVSAFLDPQPDEAEDMRELQAAIGELHEQMADGGLREAVPLDVVREALQAVLDDPARGGVPTGAVTFSAMASLRDLPYRVICAVGLADGAFPGTSKPAEFDLMDKAPRAGDRQRREDDRNVFLDLLLAARERLYLSYVGRSIRDNAALPPSVLVAELLDVLVPATARVGADKAALAEARRRLVVEHPLQPFSLEAFDPHADPRKRSFHAEYAEALRMKLRAAAGAAASGALAGAPAATPFGCSPGDDLDDELVDEDAVDEQLPPFFTVPLAPPGDEWRSVTVDQLVRFFSYPCQYLLRHRLGVRLEDAEEELIDDEPFVVDRDARKALAHRLLPLYLQGASHARIRALAGAGTEYPPGRLGERLLERELMHLDVYARELAPLLAEPCVAPVESSLIVEVNGAPWELSATWGELRRTGLVGHRYDDTRAADYLAAWIRHLAVNAAAPAGVSPTTVWQSRDGRFTLSPATDAQARLAELLALYARGLCAPLHFFPRSAWEYARHQHDLRKARGKWLGHPLHGGEKDYPAYRLALRGIDDPLDAAFEACAAAVFDPLLACIHDARLKA